MTTSPVRVAILGSTGSIGRQAVEIAERFPERVDVVALAARSNAPLIAEQARRLGVSHVALADPNAAEEVRSLLGDIEVSAGPDAVVEVASLDAEIVLNALVGAAGLRATVAALESGSRLALANKESLVVAGELVMALAEGDRLIPVDSEHSAIFKCLVGESTRHLRRIWLTASGGPFRGWDRERLAAATREQALEHPRWTMGPKITVDSATLMNKGLEAIEAHHLFGLGYEDIRVVVHPQSCVHSMVEFVDGSVKAHLGATDMRIPIQYALSFPARWSAPVEPVDFVDVAHLTFEEPDHDSFRLLGIAMAAGRRGGTMPCVMNAANEVAVAAFLDGRAGFLDIERVVGDTMERHTVEPLESITQIEAVDAWARDVARSLLPGAAGE